MVSSFKPWCVNPALKLHPLPAALAANRRDTCLRTYSDFEAIRSSRYGVYELESRYSYESAAEDVVAKQLF